MLLTQVVLLQSFWSQGSAAAHAHRECWQRQLPTSVARYDTWGTEHMPCLVLHTPAHRRTIAGYNAVASYDRKYWFRIPASYNAQAGVLEISHKPTRVSSVPLWASELRNFLSSLPPVSG